MYILSVKLSTHIKLTLKKCNAFCPMTAKRLWMMGGVQVGFYTTILKDKFYLYLFICAFE